MTSTHRNAVLARAAAAVPSPAFAPLPFGLPAEFIELPLGLGSNAFSLEISSSDRLEMLLDLPLIESAKRPVKPADDEDEDEDDEDEDDDEKVVDDEDEDEDDEDEDDEDEDEDDDEEEEEDEFEDADSGFDDDEDDDDEDEDFDDE